MHRRIFLLATLALLLACGGYLVSSRSSFKAEAAAKLLLNPAATNSGVAASSAKTLPSLGKKQTNPALSREFDLTVNPYAGALRTPGKSKRAWDADFINGFKRAATGDAIEFELTQGVMASGKIQMVQQRGGELTYLSGELTRPERGKFFFLTPPPGGKAGKAVGVVEFPARQKAYRIEPTGPNGDPELWERRLDEVICQAMPQMDAAAIAAESDLLQNAPPLRPDAVPDYLRNYNSNIVSLQSYPGSPAVLLLDFFGGYTPTWGGVAYPKPNVSNAAIKDLWKRVAEDFMAFNINVTTDIRIYQNASAASRQRCVFTPSTSALPGGAAGVAYIGSWNWGSDTVCWSIYTSGKAGAEVGAHEPGHTLGLSHETTDINNVHTEYFTGQGNGACGWAPIMGAGYYQNVTTWANGEYQNAGNLEDQFNVIATGNNNVAYRSDDTGSTLATSRYLEAYADTTISAEGVIEQPADTDAFQFTTSGGQVSLAANAVGDWADLAVMTTLADASDTVIASNNPQNNLAASITTNLPAGTYTFRVTGAGRNNPLTSGFSAYASRGYYSVTGTVAGVRVPTRLSVAEHSPNGTVVGVVAANNLNASPLDYTIVGGNSGSTFSIDAAGVVRVADNTLLDYYQLATNTLLAVQFELLVNITNEFNPAFTELNRRVVIALLNVNDPPVVTGFTNSILEHTQRGFVVGTVTATDPDMAGNPSFTIIAGNSDGMFAIDPQGGGMTVAGDLNIAAQSGYHLTIQVSDNAAANPLTGLGFVTINVQTNATAFQPGSISYALYDDIGYGNLVSDLTTNTRFPNDPSSELQMTSAEGINNRDDAFGAVMRGYLIPPASGNYTFWIASDDNSELWLSPTTNPATMTRIASVSGNNNWTSPREWTKYASQKSTTRPLVAGQGYYIEARMKEGAGGDNLAVAWAGPATGGQTNVIPGQYLAPYFVNYLPHAIGFTNALRQDAFYGTTLGAVTVTDVNAADGHTFAITTDNSGGLFAIDAATGVMRLTNAVGLFAAGPTNYILQITVTDNGTPPLSGNTAIAINVVATNAITTTTLRREIWNNIGSSTSVSSLTNSAVFPRRPDALEDLDGFASAQDIGDNYGSRIRGLLTPTDSGSYRFFIASDDNSSLYLSPDTNPTNAVLIASVSSWTDPNQWTKYNSQRSAVINLTAGQSYYIRALQKEGSGGDHIEVAWAGPGIVDFEDLPSTNVIDGSFLTPVDLNYAPVMTNQTLSVFSTVGSNTFIGYANALDSSLDALTFNIIAGNTNNMFAIAPTTGGITLLDNTLIANGTVTNFPLTVAVQDSGYGGLYPLHTAQATVTIVIGSTNAPFMWVGGAGTNNWASSGNWGGQSPGPGTRVVFGYPSQQTNFNDAASNVAWAQFVAGGFDICGNPLTLQSGLTNSTGTNIWSINTTLGAPQTWVSSGGNLIVTGAITNAGNPLTFAANSDIQVSGPISGTGSLTKNGNARLLMQGVHAYTGVTTVASAGSSSTALQLSGELVLSNTDLALSGRMDLVNFNATLGALNGNGTVFANDIPQPALILGANGHSGTFTGTIQDNTIGLSVTLGVVKIGAGKQTLTGTQTYTGLTTISNGTLEIDGTLRASPVLVASGSLAGTGKIGAAVTVQGGGAIAPGTNGIGTLTLSNSPTLAGTMLMEIRKGANPNADRLAVSGKPLAYGGTLSVANLNTNALVIGDSFQLFSAPSYSGNFAATNLPALSSGLSWVWSPTNGTLSVAVGPSTVPTNLVFAVLANGLQLSWPADHIGWRLQAQTNNLDQGISTNWFDLVGTAATNLITLPVAESNAAVFYRLVYP